MKKNDEIDIINIEGIETDELAVKRIKKLPSRFNIKLKPEFFARPQKEQQKYLHELASTLNHALDVMQKERDQIIVTCKEQEALIKKLHETNSQLASQVQLQVTQSNALAQARVTEIMELKDKLRKAKRG